MGDIAILDFPSSNPNIRVGEEERVYPLCLPYLEKNQVIRKIIVPSFFEIKKLPQTVKIYTPFGCFERIVSNDKNVIKIEYNFESTMIEIPIDKYVRYKEFIENSAKASNEGILLERISSNGQVNLNG